MKINKAKLIVGTLAIAATAATVGSISGTVAWFQYSTRSTAAYQGAAAHCSESLQIRIRANEVAGQTLDNDWHQDLTTTMINSYLLDSAEHGGAGRSNINLTPVTSDALVATEVADTLYKNPIYQLTDPTSWTTASPIVDYIVIPLELRVLDVTGAATDSFLGGKPIYISDLTLMARANHDEYVAADHLDLSKALRVGVSASNVSPVPASLTDYGTFSSDGAAVDTYGNLDLNADGSLDLARKYEWEDAGDPIVYGTNSSQALSLDASTKVDSGVAGVVDDETPSSIAGLAIGNTSSTGNKTLAVDLKIYLEGWTKIDNTGGKFKGTVADHTAIEDKSDGDIYQNSTNNKFYTWDGSAWAETTDPQGAIWDAPKGIGAEFNVGIRFSTNLHQASE